MQLKYLFLMSVFLFGSLSVNGQNSELSENDRNMQRQRNREEAQTMNAISRQKIIAEQKNVRTIHTNEGISLIYKPTLTRRDVEAITVSSVDTKAFAAFLEQPNTGIMRLQSADICPPVSMVIQAGGNCPNNITGKATAYSFRKSDYTTKVLADVFFAGNNFSSTGAFTIGIFSNLGDAKIEDLTAASDGIKQLTDFQPGIDKAEINKQYQTLTKGVQIGNYIYKREVEAKENVSYVLRTIAYKGKIFQGQGINKINILDGDDRKDLTLIFRLVRKHEDGSVTLIWKQLQEKASPKIVLEENEKDINKKNLEAF